MPIDRNDSRYLFADPAFAGRLMALPANVVRLILGSMRAGAAALVAAEPRGRSG